MGAETGSASGAGAGGARGAAGAAPTDEGEELGLVTDTTKNEPYQRPLDEHLASRRENARLILAGLLVVLLFYVLYEAFKRAETWDDANQLVDVALPAITGLIGSAVGFYFGTRK